MAVVLEVTAANKLLLARVETFMSFPVVLARKCLAANAAHEGTLIGMSAEMRSQVVGTCESLRAQSTLESRWVLLCTFRASAFTRRRSGGIGKI